MMKTKKQKNQKKVIVIATSVILLTVIGLLLAYFLMHKSPAHTSGENSTSTSTTTNNSGSISSPKGDTTTTTTSVSPSTTPTDPTGTFVSNHHPNLSGSPAPNQESSTCSTTPGTKCEIRFTNGNIVKSLPAKTTDSNGNISWDWSLSDIGLTQGEWTITAIATNGNKVATTTDSMLLSVQK